ncbi:thioredoxin domain-containing protein [Geomicrobium sp. JCM 19055]|uniref:thioredoxin domain-containing protein n=1 Tax=Geomicrobium sp. JCM 19055 TaxID=1460649 RepID=UPI00045ED46C|nr:thioredoxin domain-containing protein [Geomicrobium sp. JCM 19055]GAJ97684.1 periplasmic thiol:disulfide interchange protein DsbA [Geomicrobium sp. JCM 19055]
MKRLVITTVAIGVAVIAAFFFLMPEEEKQVIDEIDRSDQPYLGDEEAPVSIIEFGDYKCPACKVWDETVFQQLKGDYIEGGLANLTFINTPFHGAESILASYASESVWDNHPEAFWEFHEALYHAQPEAAHHDEEWVTIEELLRIASEDVEQTIDVEQLEVDIREGNYEDEVNHDINLVNEHDVQLTPTIVINGVMIEDPFDYDRIVEEIEKHL